MSLDLYVTGRSIFKNSRVLSRKRYYGQSLVGTVDGANTVLMGQFAPWDTARVPVIYHDGVAYATSAYTLDYVAGKITFTAAPASGVALTADYTYIEIPDVDIDEILKDGFDEMVLQLGVDWDLNDDGTHLYIEDADGDDPEVNSTTFSVDRPSKMAYGLCCQYRFLLGKAQDTAAHNRSVKSGDVAVNSTKNPDQLRALLPELRNAMIEALSALTITSVSSYGSYVATPTSNEYDKWFAWRDNVSSSVDEREFP